MVTKGGAPSTTKKKASRRLCPDLDLSSHRRATDAPVVIIPIQGFVIPEKRRKEISTKRSIHRRVNQPRTLSNSGKKRKKKRGSVTADDRGGQYLNGVCRCARGRRGLHVRLGRLCLVQMQATQSSCLRMQPSPARYYSLRIAQPLHYLIIGLRSTNLPPLAKPHRHLWLLGLREGGVIGSGY